MLPLQPQHNDRPEPLHTLLQLRGRMPLQLHKNASGGLCASANRRRRTATGKKGLHLHGDGREKLRAVRAVHRRLPGSLHGNGKNGNQKVVHPVAGFIRRIIRGGYCRIIPEGAVGLAAPFFNREAITYLFLRMSRQMGRLFIIALCSFPINFLFFSSHSHILTTA